MKISIITIAYNCEDCIGQTIESVLKQSVLNKEKSEQPTLQQPADTVKEELTVEYLIIDGASRDQTVAVAESYRPALEALGVAYHVQSEPDEGIYDAMNKGISLATGDVIGILNSGDWYEPETLSEVWKQFWLCDLLFGNIRMHKADGTSFVKKARQRKYQTSRDWNHPTTFVRAELIKKYPFRKLGIHDDYGFYLQMRKLGVAIVTVDKVLANFRMGGVSNKKGLKASVKRIRDRYLYCYRVNGYSRWYLVECVVMEAAKMILG